MEETNQPHLEPADSSVSEQASPTLTAIALTRYETLRELVAQVTAPSDAEKTIPPITVDFVHDLRVALRRLGEVVKLMQVMMSQPAADAVAETLSQALKNAGELRDLDVLAQHISHWRLPAGMSPLRQHILNEAPQKRQPLVERLHAELTSAGFAQALLVLARVLVETPLQTKAREEKLRAALQKRLKRRRKQLREEFAQAVKKQTSSALHQARIAAKKLRYTLELANEAQTENCKKELRLLKTIQSLLGDMHDADVITQTLRTHSESLEAPAAKKLKAPLNKWLRQTQKKQSERAAHFFAKSYLWMNQTY